MVSGSVCRHWAAGLRGDLLDILEHPNPDCYAGQRILVIRREDWSKILSDVAIYLEEFDRSAGNLDESDYHSRTWTVRRDDDFLPAQGLLQVVNLEGHMRDRLDEVGIGRPVPVPLPLDAEGIALVVTHGDFQVGKIDFPFKASRRGDANVVEPHSAVSI